MWISREDINKLGNELGFAGFSPYALTIRKADIDNFLQRPDISWKRNTHAPEDIIEYLDEWMPQLDRICNLEFIESNLPPLGSNGGPMRSDYDWLKVVLNRALNGWNPDIDGPLDRRTRQRAPRRDGTSDRSDT